MGFIPRHTCSDLEKGGLTWTSPPLGTERVGKNLTSPIPDPRERWALALVLEPRACWLWVRAASPGFAPPGKLLQS